MRRGDTVGQERLTDQSVALIIKSRARTAHLPRRAAPKALRALAARRLRDRRRGRRDRGAQDRERHPSQEHHRPAPLHPLSDGVRRRRRGSVGAIGRARLQVGNGRLKTVASRPPGPPRRVARGGPWPARYGRGRSPSKGLEAELRVGGAHDRVDRPVPQLGGQLPASSARSRHGASSPASRRPPTPPGDRRRARRHRVGRHVRLQSPSRLDHEHRAMYLGVAWNPPAGTGDPSTLVANQRRIRQRVCARADSRLCPGALRATRSALTYLASRPRRPRGPAPRRPPRPAYRPTLGPRRTGRSRTCRIRRS
jgi:hypothetical protein